MIVETYVLINLSTLQSPPEETYETRHEGEMSKIMESLGQ